jgi:hypothetical protein
MRGLALAPARLAREDVRTLRKLYAAAHPTVLARRIGSHDASEVEAVLHVDREDERKLALAKLGRDAPRVLLRATTTENSITVQVFASGYRANEPNVVTTVATHKFRRSTPVNEWTRILGRHCRHALGVLAHLRIRTLAEIFSQES